MPYNTLFLVVDGNQNKYVQLSQMTDSTAKKNLLAHLIVLVNELSQLKDVKYKDYEKLFDDVLSSRVFAIHKNSYDRFFRLTNTSSIQKAMGIIREKALVAFEREFNALVNVNEFQAAADKAAEALNKPIFSLPRQNWFKTYEGLTNSQRKIEELLIEMERTMKNSNLLNPILSKN
jgi:hypothetical protein